MRKEIKDKKRTRCNCDCKADIKKKVSYYRDGKYYKSISHYKKMKKEKANAKS